MFFLACGVSGGLNQGFKHGLAGVVCVEGNASVSALLHVAVSDVFLLQLE